MTIKSDCELKYVACGCNRTTQALAWSKNGLIAYGGCNSIFIYEPKKFVTYGEIISVLNGHQARVNCVQWIEQHKHEGLEVISGSSDKSIILWRKSDKWEAKQHMLGHDNAVCALASVTYVDNDQSVSLIGSAASDSTVRIWRREASSDFICCQTMSFGNGFVHALDMCTLPNSKGVLLACGCDDTVIRLYVLKEKLFEHVLNLIGHEDWVRCLAFTKTSKETDVFLASGSQDTYVRLWKVFSDTSELETNSDDLALKEKAFVSSDEKFHVVLESVLIGHEGWVQGLSWGPFHNKAPTLLSASMDKTMIIWEYDDSNQVWLDQARMGDVGGNTLGYYGCAFGADNQSVVGHDYQGALRLWSREENMSGNQWKSIITVSGHFGEVEDFDWDPFGEFAITVSTDQTTRLFAPWRRDQDQESWHEIARPQVHGYDMKCLAMLNRYQYAAGAQEKVIRVFTAPKAFHDTFASICKIKEDSQVGQTLPLGATIPVLGLSNKAVYEGDIKSWEKDKEQQTQPMKASAFANEDPVPFNPTLISEPPVEDVLLQNTLWPETQKLYGHGFELFAIASSHAGDILASSCKASKPEYANILIWDTSTWTQKDSLIAHTLTVTQICFSPCDKYLLSVSRDRTWALHERSSDKSCRFSLLQKTDKKTSIHARIIWACDWTSDSKYFATVSRDKKTLMWGRDDTNQCWSVKGEPLDLEQSVTAVSISQRKTLSERYIIALGLESGGVHVFSFCEKSEPCWSLVETISKSLCPVLTVKRLRWRPSKGPDEMQLGVCSSDHSFRILNFHRSMFS